VHEDVDPVGDLHAAVYRGFDYDDRAERVPRDIPGPLATKPLVAAQPMPGPRSQQWLLVPVLPGALNAGGGLCAGKVEAVAVAPPLQHLEEGVRAVCPLDYALQLLRQTVVPTEP
jgi:hypothetical protein